MSKGSPVPGPPPQSAGDPFAASGLGLGDSSSVFPFHLLDPGGSRHALVGLGVLVSLARVDVSRDVHDLVPLGIPRLPPHTLPQFLIESQETGEKIRSHRGGRGSGLVSMVPSSPMLKAGCLRATDGSSHEETGRGCFIRGLISVEDLK